MRSEETVARIVPPHSARRGSGSDPFCLLDMKEDAWNHDCSWQSSYVHEENQPWHEATLDNRTGMERTWGLDDVTNLPAPPVSRGEAG